MSQPDAAATAKRTLFQLGHELPGRRLRQLATELLVATGKEPDAPAEDLVERAVSAVEDGPTALLAEEPNLRRTPLSPPASSVEEGATATVRALATGSSPPTASPRQGLDGVFSAHLEARGRLELADG